ncbi:hypothetical protein M569_00795, partial [Genlisea aurea]
VGIAKVVLKKGKTQLFKDGNPMVYSGAVDRIIGRPPPITGDVVLVSDGAEKTIGWGLYNSVSMFCVRLMQLEDETTRDPSCALNMAKLLETRIEAAVVLREQLGFPSAKTNVYRLVNSEGDRLSGLIVDIFGDEAVIASSAAWVEKYKQQIKGCIARINNINRIAWKPSVDILKEEGLDLSDIEDADLSKSHEISTNRGYVSSISNGKKVLDICCYTGGFALNAAAGGASSVTGVDSSSPALAIAKKNITLNKFDHSKITFTKQDATDFLKNAISRGDLWDLVILDPPKLAPSRKALQNASGMYRNLNSLAMRVTRRGGLLMTCSCSGAMAQSGGMFLRILQSAALRAGRKITVIRRSGASCDHTIDPAYPEGEYLSNVLLRVL